MLDATLKPRTIGAEHEFLIPLVGTGSRHDVQQMIASVLTANGLPAVARGYSHEPVPRSAVLAVEYDASLSADAPEYKGISWMSIEIKTKVLASIEEWEAVVPKALAICTYLGGRAGFRSCGHHLHVGLPEIEENPAVIRSVYNLFHRVERLIFGVVAPSRRHCGYSMPLPDRSALLHGCSTAPHFMRALAESGLERRHGLNLTHLFGGNPHVELRYHHGTLDIDKARHWMRLCLQLVQHAVQRNCQAAEQLPNDRASLEKLLVTCGFKVNSKIYSSVSPQLRATGSWLIERWKHFNGNHSLQSVRASAADSTKNRETGVAHV